MPGLFQKEALLDAMVETQAVRHMGPSLTLLVHDNVRRCQWDITLHPFIPFTGFPGGSDGKESACNAGDARDSAWSLGLDDPLKKGHGNSLQHSCLRNPMDREARQTTVLGVTNRQDWSDCTYTLQKWNPGTPLMKLVNMSSLFSFQRFISNILCAQ